MAEYTKGEWHIYDGHDSSFNCPYITTRDKPGRPDKCIARLIDGRHEEVYANANLIAAAPALYEALSELLEGLGNPMELPPYELVEQASKAIAKAEGK